MATYYPRMLLQLTLPLLGDRSQREQQADSDETFDLKLTPRRIRLLRNDASHADELTVTLDWITSGIDPRLLFGSVGVLYLGTADEFGAWDPGASDVRFNGTLIRAVRNGSGDEPATLEVEFRDYTDIFLNRRKFPTVGIPLYTDTISEGWRRICEQTPAADPLKDNLVLEGIDRDPRFAEAVHSRLASGHVLVKPEATAWEAWRTCIDLFGYITFIRGDQCVVTTARDLYSQDDPVRLTWGTNIRSMSEARNPVLNKGIALRSFDPVNGRVIDALWPDPHDPDFGRKRVKAKKTKKGTKPKANALKADKEYETFEYHGVTDKALLLQIAKAVYEQRSRQELEGTIVTSEPVVDTVSGASFDLLSLEAGAAVQIDFAPEERAALLSRSTADERISYLVDVGYAQHVAERMVANIDVIAKARPIFSVRSVGIEFEVAGDSGSLDVSINYVNKINPVGDADVAPQ